MAIRRAAARRRRDQQTVGDPHGLSQGDDGLRNAASLIVDRDVEGRGGQLRRCPWEPSVERAFRKLAADARDLRTRADCWPV
jgi:hypothetical protein